MENIFPHIQHDPFLVFLSYVIATISAYASIDLARRMRISDGKGKIIWLVSGASVLGIGIWSMHFIAMLAHHFPYPVYYEVGLVIVSVIVAAVGCVIGYYIVSAKPFNISRFLVSGVIMGLGIASMHYIGMEAIQPVTVTYEKSLFFLSIFIAVFASAAALWIGFLSPYAERGMSWKLKLIFSLLMAIAISGMHYTGMAAARYSMTSTLSDTLIDSMLDTRLLAWIVTAVTLIIFLLFFFSITFDRMWRKQEVVQSSILDAAQDGIVVSSSDGRILHANPAFYNLLGQPVKPQLSDQLQAYHPDFKNDIDVNREYHIEVTNSLLEVKRHLIEGENVDHSLWFFRDITENMQDKQKIEFMAYHDTLTQLPNRFKLEAVLSEWLDADYEVACIFLDLDRLKFTNDTLGHEAGDELLQHAAERLKTIISSNDLLARFGGDEFIILLAGDRAKAAMEIAHECVKTMEVPFTVNGVNLRITISAGVCTYPQNADSATELIRFADFSMYESKRNGKNQVTLFNSVIKEQTRRAVQIEEALLTAIDRGEFHLLYQPKISVRTGRLDSVEALLRWNHAQLGAISPAEFIPIAEERGIIDEIGEWVLREACRQWGDWTNEHDQPIAVAVNISPLQFSKDDFLPVLKQIIEDTQIDPHYLELEITESASLAFEDHMKIKLQALREMGIKISLDDFGTGYSSFRHLKEMPIEVLKIDRSFLNELIGNSGQEAIVRSMIQLGHNLNLQVLAEGVEDQLQADWLKQEGCDIVQGFFYSRPVRHDVISDIAHYSKTNNLSPSPTVWRSLSAGTESNRV
ncbi:EAL domain-containing protein [Bacillus piscicola]|uniref:EAL domain-containing protein n=1 Tax=Bacillus piscicola TaxID=1632684 RepID=UPI001F08F0D9|nr:EAL domain-containing protein [Bacillus piscicola]